MDAVIEKFRLRGANRPETFEKSMGVRLYP